MVYLVAYTSVPFRIARIIGVPAELSAFVWPDDGLGASSELNN